MHNPHISPRRRQILLLLGYALMTTAVLIISAICIMLILGYRFDFSNRSLEQGGLVQFRSVPTGANVYLDEKQLSFRTPGKQNIIAGEHTVEFQLDGYLPWRKSISLGAGELRWLNYARMIPNEIITEAVLDFEKVESSLVTPDRQFIAVVEDKSKPILSLVDIRNDTAVRTSEITLDPENVAEKISSFELESWSDNSRYLLVKVNSAAGSEFLRVDRTQPNGEPINISRLVGLDIDEVDFEESSTSELIARTGNSIRRLNLSAETVSAPLAQDVASWHVSPQGVISYVALEEKLPTVHVHIENQDFVVRTYDENKNLLTAIDTYYSDHYLAIAEGRNLEIIKSPETQDDTAGRVFAEIELQFTPKKLSFSPSGRFVLAENGLAVTIYDLETDETHSFTQGGEPAKSQDQNFTWLDSYYLYSTQAGKLVIREFDGHNQHQITSAPRGSEATLSRDGTFMYSFTEQEDGGRLVRSRLILE